MDTPRKTPRTNEAERRCHDEEGTHGLVFQSDMEALEIETQELAEALEALLNLVEGTDGCDDFTGWRKAAAKEALAVHKAKQPK